LTFIVAVLRIKGSKTKGFTMTQSYKCKVCGQYYELDACCDETDYYEEIERYGNELLDEAREEAYYEN